MLAGDDTTAVRLLHVEDASMLARVPLGTWMRPLHVGWHMHPVPRAAASANVPLPLVRAPLGPCVRVVGRFRG